MTKDEQVFCRNVNCFFKHYLLYCNVTKSVKAVCRSVVKKAYTYQVVVILRILLGRVRLMDSDCKDPYFSLVKRQSHAFQMLPKKQNGLR